VIDPNTTTVQLVVNGIVRASQFNPGNQIVLYPNDLILDSNTRSLSLDITGFTHIDTITVELSNAYGSNINLDWAYAQYIDIDLNVDALSNSYVNLNELADLSVFSGRILERVNVIAAIPDEAMPGTVTTVSLLASSQTLGQAQFSSYDPEQNAIWTDYNRFVLGQNLFDLALYSDGAIHMDRVILKVK
jgi:hypothetical protein